MVATAASETILALVDHGVAACLDAQDCVRAFRSDLSLGRLNLAELKGFILGLQVAGVLDADVHRDIECKIADAQRAYESQRQLTPGVVVERLEDMSPDGLLSMCMDGEGDIHIAVIPPKGKSTAVAPSIEFVAHCPRSRHTLSALRALMQAMARDNAESPLLR